MYCCLAVDLACLISSKSRRSWNAFSPVTVSWMAAIVLLLFAAPSFAQDRENLRVRRPTPAPTRLLVQGSSVETCAGPDNPSHILPPGSKETDLQINGITCVVDGSAAAGGIQGSYVYRNVNIYNGGTLTFRDAHIDFHAHSILVEMNGTLAAGATSPLNGPLTIWLWGTRTDGIPSIRCLSDSKNQCGVPDKVWTSNTNVAMRHTPNMPCTLASTFKYNLPGGDDCFYQYEVFDTNDTAGAYFGRKVLAVSFGGNLLLRGAKGIRTGPIEASPADSGTSWGHLTKNLVGGGSETSLYIDRAVPTWSAGDHIVVTTTDFLPGHTEELVIKDVGSDANGTRIDIDTSQLGPMNAVQFPHWGEAYDYSSIAEAEANSGVG